MTPQARRLRARLERGPEPPLPEVSHRWPVATGRGTKVTSWCRQPGTVLAIGLLTDPTFAQLLAGVQPGRIAAQLAPYAAGGWQPAHLADALLNEAFRRGITTWQPAWSPYGLLKTLLSGIDTITGQLIPARFGDGRSPDPVPEWEPCGAPGCDDGWIHFVTEAGYDTVKRCHTCPPRSHS